MQSYCSPLLPATDPFLPALSLGFQAPFNKVLTTALSASDNKFPLPAKTAHAEQSSRDEKRRAKPYSRRSPALHSRLCGAQVWTALPANHPPGTTRRRLRSCRRGCATPILCCCIKARLCRLKTLSLRSKHFSKRYFLPFTSYHYGAGEQLGKSLNPEYNYVDEYLT